MVAFFNICNEASNILKPVIKEDDLVIKNAFYEYKLQRRHLNICWSKGKIEKKTEMHYSKT